MKKIISTKDKIEFDTINERVSSTLLFFNIYFYLFAVFHL